MTLHNLLGSSLEAIEPDAASIQRNVSDYSGDPVPRSAVDECFRRATDLEVTVQDWLAHQHPDLLP